MGAFVGKNREMLSAYRVLADEMGYEMGQFVRNEKSDTATAPIKRKPGSGGQSH